MTYLTRNPSRNRLWTEHANFPHKAVKIQVEREARSQREGWPIASRIKDTLEVYKMSEDKQTFTFVPREDWPSV